jgi:hypothetical protein
MPWALELLTGIEGRGFAATVGRSQEDRAPTARRMTHRALARENKPKVLFMIIIPPLPSNSTYYLM